MDKLLCSTDGEKAESDARKPKGERGMKEEEKGREGGKKRRETLVCIRRDRDAT